MTIFELTLRGPLYLGEFVGINREVTLDWVPSDTLFAAIVTAWAQQNVDVNARLAPFAADPPLSLTSAFPRAGHVRFYPAPPRLPQHSGLFAAGQSAKVAKKIRWLSQGVLDALIAGQTPARDDENWLHGKTVWLTSTERRDVERLLSEDDDGQLSLWRKQIVPHVTVDRASSASNLFHTGRVTFGAECGVWFAARGQTDWVRSALTYLSDAGLGGLRSTGHGGFTFTEAANDLPAIKDGEWGLCLSRYAPQTEAEITQGLQAEKSAYQLVTIGGWCQDDDGHAWRRRSVRMLAEGALLPSVVRGGLIDVRPQAVPQFDHRAVYRNGFAFLIPAGRLAEAL